MTVVPAGTATSSSASQVDRIVRLVLRLRRVAYLVALATSLAVLSVVGSGRAALFCSILAVGTVSAFWRRADDREHLYVILVLDSMVGLGLWWLDGPAAGGHFLLFYAVVVGSLLLNRRKAGQVLIAAVLAAVSQIALHFTAKTWGLPLFHAPDGVPDVKFSIGVGISVILLVAMAGLFVAISSILQQGVRTEEHNEALTREIDERTKAQELAERLRNRNLSILNAAGQGIFGLSREGTVTFVNPAASRLLDHDPETLMGQHIHSLIHHSWVDGSQYPWTSCPVHRTLETGENQRITDEVFFRSDGGSFVVEYIVTPVCTGDEVAGAVVTFDDVTESRLMEARLAQAEKLESLGQLAAGMAHEINSPMQYVTDNASFLEGAIQKLVGPDGSVNTPEFEALAADIPDAFSDLQDGIERVTTIVQAMKSFSHPGGDQHALECLNELVQSTVIVSRNEWKYVADLDLELDESLPRVLCDSSEISQALLNLVVNASHAIADANVEAGTKGRITVSTRRDGDWAEIVVTDTGTGIPDKVRDKIFDPFFTTKDVGRGTGQGLTMANASIVERHDGELLVDTEVGHGTTFTMRLPLHSQQSEVAA